MPYCQTREIKRQVASWISPDSYEGWERFGAKDEWVPWEYVLTPTHSQNAINVMPPDDELTDRQRRLRELWAKSDAAIKEGMPTLDLEGINAEVACLRGRGRGDL